MNNDKRFLYIVLPLLFAALTFLTVGWLESHVQRKQMSFLLEFEKLINQLYQAYQSEGDMQEYLDENIPGFGFYNFHGKALYRYGTAPEEMPELSMRPFFNKDRKTIVIQRDFLNPFNPVVRDPDKIREMNQTLFLQGFRKSEEEKLVFVRYVYLEMHDTQISYFKTRFRILQILFVVLTLIVFSYLTTLYRRNMKYRKQIESQERLVVLGTAARTLTHEVKNPLSSIRLQTTIIRRSGCGGHEPSLRIIDEEVQRLSSLTGKIGDFLRQPEGTPERTDLAGEVRPMTGRISPDIRCIVPSDPAELPVLIDPERLRSIVDNLLNNALESGCGADEIAVELEHKGHEAHLIIRDRGTGIPEEHLEHLYDPFFTTKSRGSGVGLSIVNSFTRAAGGSLHIRSEKDKGTEVTVSLPLIKE